MRYYKFLTADNRGEYSRYDFTAYLPTDDQPGPWLPVVDEIKLCEKGYHAAGKENLVDWINVQLFEVELGADVVDGDKKSVSSKMRFLRKVDAWNDRTARLFACWCAEQVLPIYEKHYPNDTRPRNSIDVARRYANGEATAKELAAARAAAWAAVGAAARDAAWAAARDAAGATARATARDAALDWARAAVRDAQNVKLVEMLGLED